MSGIRKRILQRRLRAFFRPGAGEGEAGSAMVEFAFAFPLQLAITFGILQMVLLLVSGLVVNYAAFKACRAALVDENPKEAARVVLAPLAGRSVPGGQGADVQIENWGPLRGSGTAYDKLDVQVEGGSGTGTVTVRVTFEQELVFPFIDALLGIVMGRVPTSPSFGGHDEASGRVRVYPGNRIHLLVTRSHTMSRDTERIPDLKEPSIYEFSGMNIW